MRTPLLSVLVAAHAVLCPVAASADSGYWTDRQICRAAVKTYFFLGIKPAIAPDNGEFWIDYDAAANIAPADPPVRRSPGYTPSSTSAPPPMAPGSRTARRGG